MHINASQSLLYVSSDLTLQCINSRDQFSVGPCIAGPKIPNIMTQQMYLRSAGLCTEAGVRIYNVATETKHCGIIVLTDKNLAIIGPEERCTNG